MFDEVHGDRVPRAGRDRKLLEESVGFVARSLRSFARCARIAVVLYEVSHVRPGILPSDKFQCLVLAEVSRYRVVVLVVKHPKSEVGNVWNINSVIEKQQTFCG
jgi:hypothetical protein